MNKMLIRNLIDYVFLIKKNVRCCICVRKNERTVLRLWQSDLKFRNFCNISDDQLDSDVLALTNDYPFCSETILRERLKESAIIIQRYQFRLIMHRISKVGILTLTINLSSGTLLYSGQLMATAPYPYHWNVLAIIRLL